jgi:hypothetical protein
MAVKEDKDLTIHGKGGRETSTGKKGLKNPDPVAIYAGRKTKEYLDSGAGTHCTTNGFKLLRGSLND